MNSDNLLSRLLFVGAALAGLQLAGGCRGFIVNQAPAKTPHTAEGTQVAQAKQSYWSALHAGEYGALDEVIEGLTAQYLEHPRDPELTLLLGLAHLWYAAERDRLSQINARVTDSIILAERYLSEARALAPDDDRIGGWLASARIARASIDDDPRLQRRAYFELKDSMKAYPEFNGFTFGYSLTAGMPGSHPRYVEATEAFWHNVDVCIDQAAHRTRLAYADYAREFKGRKRVCGNSWIAPHNLEGFFLAMGDAHLKAGQVDSARLAYRNAAGLPSFEHWPYRDQVQARLDELEARADRFTDGDPDNDPELMVNSGYACTGCHQGTVAPYSTWSARR